MTTIFMKTGQPARNRRHRAADTTPPPKLRTRNAVAYAAVIEVMG